MTLHHMNLQLHNKTVKNQTSKSIILPKINADVTIPYLVCPVTYLASEEMYHDPGTTTMYKYL